jgi:small subunit ribosomal protein S5
VAKGYSAGTEGSSSGLLEEILSINRTSKTVKGGRRFGFSALAVVGDQKGRAGYGFGKANEVPPAVEKATSVARASLVRVSLEGPTLPHAVWGKFGASRVYMKPAPAGTGVKAGGTVRSVMNAFGVRDVVAKCYGSRNPVNLVKAVFSGLQQLRSHEEVERLRGVRIRPQRVASAPVAGGVPGSSG